MARPWKYHQLIKALKDDELYHTSKVIRFCNSLGLFDFSFDYEDKRLNEKEKKQVMAKARSSLAHFAAKHLPKKPDDYLKVEKPYRGFYPVWFGKTWKEALGEQKS